MPAIYRLSLSGRCSYRADSAGSLVGSWPAPRFGPLEPVQAPGGRAGGAVSSEQHPILEGVVVGFSGPKDGDGPGSR